MSKRYEALYIHPNFCDGFYDNEEKRYLKVEEVNELLNYKLKSDEIEEILNRKNCEIIGEEKDMSDIKLALEGLGIVGVGLFSIVWYIVKLISSAMIAGLISVKLGLINNYWLFGSIILFCVINKIIFWGNSSSTYSELADNYKNKTKHLKE